MQTTVQRLIIMCSWMSMIGYILAGCAAQVATQPPVKCPALIEYIGNYPKDRENGWGDNIQGIADDDSEYWFVTQETKIWKIPIAYDLNRRLNHDPSQGILLKRIEDTPLEGYVHFGDPDYFDGHLFVPVEGEGGVPPVVAVFDADSLQYVTASPLTGQSKAGWLAINPQDGLLYTSDKTISEIEPMLKYRLDLSPNQNSMVLTRAGELRLKDENGQAITLSSMQGGVFSRDGCLFLINGYYKDFSASEGGISVVDSRTGTRLAKSANNSRWGEFGYEFHPGYTEGMEEPEGITLWDLDRDTRAPGIDGQLHAIMLDNDIDEDDLYIKHYRLSHYVESALEKEVATPDQPTATHPSPGADY